MGSERPYIRALQNSRQQVIVAGNIVFSEDGGKWGVLKYIREVGQDLLMRKREELMMALGFWLEQLGGCHLLGWRELVKEQLSSFYLGQVLTSVPRTHVR